MAIFSYVSDLPPQVRSVLDVGLQQVWLAAYNASFSLTNSEAEAYQYAWVKVFQLSFPGEIDVQTMPQVATSPQPVGMDEVQAFTIDLQAVKLNDDNTSWIQAFPVGTWQHPVHGKIEMTPERAMRFAQNVNSGVRGQDLDIDYDHKEKTNEASGWVKAAQAKADGLWLQVQWTADAARKIKDKAYRYFSPEYLDEWVEPRSKQKIKDVLLGGALTNRPFLKGILPVNLSEVLSNTKAHNDGGKMDWNEIRAMLGLPDGTPEGTVKAEFAKRINPVASNGNDGSQTQSDNGGQTTTTTTAPAGQPTTTTTQPANTPEPPNTGTSAPTSDQLVGAGLSEHVARLAESDPVIRELSEQVAKLSATAKLSEVAIKLNSLGTDEAVLSPSAKEELKELLLEAPTALSDKIFKLFKSTVENGIVKLGETGHTSATDNNASPVKRFSDLVDAKMKSDTTMTYGDAVEAVSQDNPALFEEYRRGSYLRENA